MSIEKKKFSRTEVGLQGRRGIGAGVHHVEVQVGDGDKELKNPPNSAKNKNPPNWLQLRGGF